MACGPFRENKMTAIVYMIFMCMRGSPRCIQANDSVYPSPKECFAGMSRQYPGELRPDGRFYVRGGKNSWLRCEGVSTYDGTVVRKTVLP